MQTHSTTTADSGFEPGHRYGVMPPSAMQGRLAEQAKVMARQNRLTQDWANDIHPSTTTSIHTLPHDFEPASHHFDEDDIGSEFFFVIMNERDDSFRYCAFTLVGVDEECIAKIEVSAAGRLYPSEVNSGKDRYVVDEYRVENAKGVSLSAVDPFNPWLNHTYGWHGDPNIIALTDLFYWVQTWAFDEARI